MSYTYKVLWNDEFYDLPDYEDMSFGYDYNDVGAITFKYAKTGINAWVLYNPYATIITYWDGAEVKNSRFIVLAVDDSYDPEDVYITVKARTLHDVFRKTVTRNPSAPGESYRFVKSTPGGILDRLFKDAQSRGAMTGIQWSFTPSLTTRGKAWDKSITIEYKPGTKYLDIIRNLAAQGLIDIEFTGSSLDGYNDSENSADYAQDTGKQIELRAGLDYEEMPNRMSAENRANYSLIIGNDALWTESTRLSEPLSPYGREEQAISQGGMSDLVSMAIVNESNLFSASRTTNEYTRKVIIRDGGPVPGVDYKPGDWILDRVGGSLPNRLRVVSIAIGVDDRGQVSSAALTLNDRIQDFNMRLARKVDGIIGGATADGSGNGIPTNKVVDKTVPRPVEGLTAVSGTYTDNNGYVQGAATSNWLPPKLNMDGSTLNDLSHYEIEHQVDGTIQWTSPTSFGPMKVSQYLGTRFDRRGNKTPGWVGADGGGNWQDDDARNVYHAWGDTMFGTIISGKRSVYMPRNSITMFDKKKDNKNLTTFVGSENLVPLNVARCDNASAWTGNNATLGTTAWAGGYGGTSITITSKIVGNVGASTTLARMTSQNEKYKPIRAGKKYRVMATIDTTKTSGKTWLAVNWSNGDESPSYTGERLDEIIFDANGVADKILTAPANAVDMYLAVMTTATAVGQSCKFTRVGVFETTHMMSNWRLPQPNYTVFNEVADPNGGTKTQGAVQRTNYMTNPGFYNNTSAYTSTSGATVTRDLQYVQGATNGTPLVAVQNPAVLDRWQTAINNRYNSSANAIAIGTSVTSGLSTSNFRNRYQTRLVDYLRGSDYPTTGVTPNMPGKGYQGVLGFIPGYYNADPTCPSLPGPDGQGGGGSRDVRYGLGGQTLMLENGAWRRFKATFDNISFMLVTSETNGAPFAIIVDGVELTGTTRTGSGDGTINLRWTKTLENKEHVVEIRNTNRANAWGSVGLCGVYLYSGDYNKGIHLIDGSQSGWSAKLFMDNAVSLAPAYAMMRPSLITIEFGYNDAGSGLTSAQFKTKLKDVITALKTACASVNAPTPAFLVIGGYDPGDAQYGKPDKPAGSWPEPWPNYLSVMSQVATEDSSNVAFVNLATVMPRISDDTSGLYDGSIHPTDKGHALMAKILRGVLAPVSVSNKLGSARVSVNANTTGAGIQSASVPTTGWASGDTYTYSMYVRAPIGSKLNLVTTCAPGVDVTKPVSGTGDWQRITASGTYTGAPTAGPTFKIVTADNTQVAFNFWVTKVMLDKSGSLRDYFDGETPATTSENFTWTSTRYASTSTSLVTRPTSWTSNGTTMTDVGRYNLGGVKCQGGTYVTSPLSGSTTSSSYTAIAWVKATEVGTARIELKNSAGSSIVTGPWIDVRPDEWIEVRAEGGMASGVTGVSLVMNKATTFTTSEVTYVAGKWSGGSFTGSSMNKENIKCSWLGTPNNSRTQAVYPNTNYVEVGFKFFGERTTADRPTQLVSSMLVDGANPAEWLWASDGANVGNNKAMVFYPAVMSSASVNDNWNFDFNGSHYVAEYDLTTNKMTRFRRWARDPRGGKQSISWGNAVVVNGGYLFVYGSRSVPGSNSQNHNFVCRIAINAPFTNNAEVWTSTGWKETSTDPGTWELNAATKPEVIATTPGAGFSSVRTWDNKWYALVMGGLSRDLSLWVSTGASGAWSFDSNLYTVPGNKILGYSPKFQIATDGDAEGFSALLSQTTGESVMNPTLYAPVWLRGPGGTGAAMNGLNWIDHSEVYEPPFTKGGLKPGSVYSIRVRAVDNANPPNYSSWVGSPPIIVAQDTQGPNKPSTPLVTVFFQGARVVWDGNDTAGNAMPGDYDKFEVHISTDESFVPSPTTMADVMRTRGGVSPIQGLSYGQVYWVRIVAYDGAGNASEPSDAVSVEPQRLSDPDLPDKLITGAKIADGAINTMNITVGAFSNNLIPNGNMEDVNSAGNIVGWKGYFCEDPVADSAYPIAGSSSTKYSVVDGNKIILSAAMPITPGAIYYLSLKVRTSRKLDRGSVHASLAVATSESRAGSGFGQDVRLGEARTLGGTDIVTLEGQAEVPWDETLRFGRVVVTCELEDTPYDVWIDDVELKKIVGEAAIANAAINSAKIKNLAVDDSKIANLSVGKVTAGRIWADWIQSGRLLTPQDSTGSWSLMDSTGFHTYKDASGTNVSFTTNGGNVYASGILEASEIRGGQAWFPSQYDYVPGRVVINEQGLNVDAAPTINLCRTPSVEFPSTVYVTNSTEVSLSGAVVTDYAGNYDLISFAGRLSLKVWNKSAKGTVAINVGKAVPNTTYTVSWYSAATTIDDSRLKDGSVYGDYGDVAVIRTDKGTPIAWGRTGYLLRDGAYQGLWKTPQSSGIGAIAQAGWVYRTYTTFTTPADLPSGTELRLQLPAPRTQSNGNEMSMAVCYDGFQMEQKPWMTRYCDGDQPGCTWDGARNNSTSRRQQIRSAWLPTQEDPIFTGNVRATDVTSRRIKLGSGVTHGSNAVETLMGNNWSLWNGGGYGWFGQITWDNQYVGNDTLVSRYSSDDGMIFPSTDASKFFYAVTGGMYAVSATITFPNPQQEGRMGLRLRHLAPGGKGDGDGSILASSFLGTHENSTNLTVTWVGWSPPGWRFYFEAYQNTQSGDANMPAHTRNTPCRAACIQFL